MPLKEVGTFSVSHLQIIDEQGQADAKLDPKLAPDKLLALYRWMSLAREADQRMLKLQRQGRMGTFPLCTGQEATACGAAFALAEQDWFVGSYRELGGRLIRGESLVQYYRYWNGYEEGNTLPDRDTSAGRRMLPTAAIIASQLLHAVGVGYACKLKAANDRERAAVITFFGDGATSEGDFHEAMNFAGVWDAPVVFVCINNHWAISQPREAQTRSQTIAQKAIAYGFEGIQVDGNDVLAVYKAADAALERARTGGGPTLIEASTYRLMMHTTADDPRRYRAEGDVESWWAKDPLPRFRRYLELKKLWDDDKEAAQAAEIKKQVEDSVREFEANTDFEADAPFDHVFGTEHPEIVEQRAHFNAQQERERQEASRG